MTEQQIREQIVETVKREYHCGMVNLFEGNVTVRDGDRIFITPSQVSKETMTPEMIIEIDRQGNVVNSLPGYKPSSEFKMHLEVYRLRPDVCAIVHNHSTYATAYACNAMPLETDIIAEINMFMGSVPVVPYGTPGTERLYAGFDGIIDDRFAVLLANHGVLTFGPDLDMAYSYAEAVEKLAQTLFLAKQLGPGSPIPAAEITALRRHSADARKKAIENAMQKP